MTRETVAEMLLSTQRLIIRHFSEQDAGGLFALMSDPGTCSDDGGYAPIRMMDKGFIDLSGSLHRTPTVFPI